MRKGLTDRQIAKLPRGVKRYTLPDPVQAGLVLRIPPKGPVSFVAVARYPRGRQIWHTVGTTATHDVDEARVLARAVIRRIKAGLPPAEPVPLPPQSVAAVAALWLERKVEAERQRSAYERRRIVGRYIIPRIGSRMFNDLRRSDVALLLDTVADQHGKRQADAVLHVLTAVSSWWATRDDAYRSPFVRGMRVAPPVRRDRILSDDEIRTLWHVADDYGSLGALLKLALLLGQRREKLLTMAWADIDAEGVWSVPRQVREKGVGGALKLPSAALEIIQQQPRIGPYVLTPRPNTHMLKRFRDKTGLTGWTVHDLRRSARSLMSRAGAQLEASERVLGHVVGGVRGTYDRHEYLDEKAAALAKLAALIERIVNPPAGNVVTLGAAS
jgi:integrase